MGASDILMMMKDDIGSLTFGQKMAGSFMVTVLSMLIVFSVLIILMISIRAMQYMIFSKQEKKIVESVNEITEQTVVAQSDIIREDEELIAVIAAAVAGSMGCSISDIRVVNIVRLREEQSAWARSGLLKQINQRL